MSTITPAMRKEAERLEVAIHAGVKVTEVLFNGRRATGVRLSSGETIRSKSNRHVGPKLLYSPMINEQHLETVLRRRVHGFRVEPGTFRRTA
ncbi:hypothetical protein [Microbulbifer sp. JMSA008]|uniref:hypothetical protein n=1 Tax=Microbulbifer sp. JMSA008 TaxID=3243373 RepID=UPI0040399265